MRHLSICTHINIRILCKIKYYPLAYSILFAFHSKYISEMKEKIFVDGVGRLISTFYSNNFQYDKTYRIRSDETLKATIGMAMTQHKKNTNCFDSSRLQKLSTAIFAVYLIYQSNERFCFIFSPFHLISPLITFPFPFPIIRILQTRPRYRIKSISI